MFSLDHKKLSDERLAEIGSELAEAGHEDAAELLAGHIAALQEELTLTSQYYEEFYIPLLESRPIQKGSPPPWHASEEAQSWLRGKLNR